MKPLLPLHSLVLGLAHGLIDASSGWLLFSEKSWAQAALLFTLYNLIGFAFQPIFGNLIDRFRQEKAGLISGLLLVMLALAPLPVQVSLLLAGIGSALFHVCAGSLCLQMQNPLSSCAFFNAPGVLGLCWGIYSARQGGNLPLALIPGLLLSLISLLGVRPPQKDASPNQEVLPAQDTLLLLTVFAIALRSALWNHFQALDQTPQEWVLWLGLSAGLGKLSGGLFAEYWGERRTAWAGLVLALFSFGLSGPSLWGLMPGILGLQMAVPLTQCALARLLPDSPATASGIALGFAIALGGIPILFRALWNLQGGAQLFVLALLGWLYYKLFSPNPPKRVQSQAVHPPAF